VSAHVVLSCERGYREGTCPEQAVVFGADTVEQARRAAAVHGWHHSGAGDRCPGCMGRVVPWPYLIQVRAQPVPGGLAG
jgi:hypothetical protein